MIQTQSKIRLILAALFTYLFMIGMTWNGVILPAFKIVSLGVMGALLITWVAIRHKANWVWHTTPLNSIVLLWLISLLISTIFNQDALRRMSIGLWYISLYICLWYILHDALANHAINRKLLADAIMLGGINIVIIGYLQLHPFILHPTTAPLPRPGSLLGNPNSLGTFLIVLLAITGTRFLETKQRLLRIIIGAYALSTAFLLLATFSRGAWLSAIAMSLTLGGLTIHSYAKRTQKIGIWLIIMVVIIIGLLIAQSLSINGRSINLRTEIYNNAINIFREKPIAGHGVFTFGKQLALQQSQPPGTTHSHAHNILLQIAAEQGLIGITTSLFSVGILLHSIRLHWQTTHEHERLALAGSIAAVVGFGVHHLFDLTAMMPLIAFLGILILSMATHTSRPVSNSRWKPRIIMGVWGVLIISGAWSTHVHKIYHDTLLNAVDNQAYRTGAERLQQVIDADPLMPVYHHQQAYLYGAAAYAGDITAIQPGINAYQRFLELEPYNAIGWTNMAALYTQQGDSLTAIKSMQRATQLAPESWQLWLILGTLAENSGNFEVANQAYGHVPPIVFLYAPKITPLQAKFSAAYQPTEYEAAILNLTPMVEANDNLSEAWVHLRLAILARRAGNEALAQREISLVEQLIRPTYREKDYRYGQNIGAFQFLRYTIPRQFLIQTGYMTNDPALLYLLEHFQSVR